MKQVLMILLSLGLFISCSHKPETTKVVHVVREKIDYSKIYQRLVKLNTSPSREISSTDENSFAEDKIFKTSKNFSVRSHSDCFSTGKLVTSDEGQCLISSIEARCSVGFAQEKPVDHVAGAIDTTVGTYVATAIPMNYEEDRTLVIPQGTLMMLGEVKYDAQESDGKYIPTISTELVFALKDSAYVLPVICTDGRKTTYIGREADKNRDYLSKTALEEGMSLSSRTIASVDEK